MAKEIELASKSVFITGGGSGIGFATAKQLRTLGWRVVIADRDAGALKRAKSAIGCDDDVFYIELDVTDEIAVERAFSKTVSVFGPIGGTVNSAGISRVIPFLSTPTEVFREIINVNLIGTFLVDKAAARHMAENDGGTIVNISSISGIRGSVGRSAYGSSKAAIINLTSVMAVELAPKGIRVNCVAPGPIETDMTRGAVSPAGRDEYLRMIPQGRYGEAEEVSSAIAFLLDNERARYITGQTLVVDGGFCSAGLQGRA
jgi:NAD(P)-dependent dehydrogenase (short-subunit alcohol dehydrogenase family)